MKKTPFSVLFKKKKKKVAIIAKRRLEMVKQDGIKPGNNLDKSAAGNKHSKHDSSLGLYKNKKQCDLIRGTFYY